MSSLVIKCPSSSSDRFRFWPRNQIQDGKLRDRCGKKDSLPSALHPAVSPGHSVYKHPPFSLSLLLSFSPSSRFSICGATRRIFYLYIITRIGPSSPFLPFVSSASALPPPPLLPRSLSLPSRRVLFLSSHAPRFPCAPRFSCSRPRPAATLARVAYALYLFYFIIKQTSSCHPRADTRLYTRPRPPDPRQTQSPLDARIGLPRAATRARHEKYFSPRCPSFSCYPGIVLPSRVPLSCYPSSRGRPLIASLKGIPS